MFTRTDIARMLLMGVTVDERAESLGQLGVLPLINANKWELNFGIKIRLRMSLASLP
jgi:hypothetical protein